MTGARRLTIAVLSLGLLHITVLGAGAAAPPSPAGNSTLGRTPPRLSYVEGEASFWRPGESDWARAEINTPLAAGDELYTGNGGNLEIQVGTRAFVRAWGDSQLGLTNQEPAFLQIKVTSGHVSFDLRSVDPGRTVEVDTPQAAFTIDRPGYYRVDVTPEGTSFVTRRGGRATMTPVGGDAAAIAPSEEVVLDGTPTPDAQSFAAGELDVWDRWNYARTDQLIEAVSARYVSPDVYGVDDLDHHGSWRVVSTYGPVWVPDAVAAGWVPYSTGKWIWDPHYGWTWVDTAPWGWAPYHYGRWVFVNGVWAWAPGPLVMRPAYAPALVAFLGVPGVQVSVGTTALSWVALGWGEPLVPWWGPVGFVGRPWWAGWGGPRVVNNVILNRTTTVSITNVTVYRNVTVQNAVVTVRHDSFGRRPVQEVRIAEVDVRRLEPVHGALKVKPEPSRMVGDGGRAPRPPENVVARQVVATRPPRPVALPGDGHQGHPAANVPQPRIVAPPKVTSPTPTPARPPFGTSQVERPRPSQPPRFDANSAPSAPRGGPEQWNPGGQAPSSQRAERQPTNGSLPGDPANRLFPGRVEKEKGPHRGVARTGAEHGQREGR